MTRERFLLILNLAITGCILIIVALVVVFVVRSVSATTWHESKPVGYNVFSPDVSDGSIVRYYTGNTFASLDTATGKRTPLTTLYTLPNVSNIHWMKDGVVFLSQTADDFTDLGKKAAEIQGNSAEVPFEKQQPTYWYLSFKDNSLKSIDTSAYDLPETTTLTTKEGDFLFKTDDSHFARLSSDGTITYDVFDAPGDTRPVYATSKELYYAQTDTSTNATHLRKVEAGENKTSSLVYENLYKKGEGTITSAMASLDGSTFFYEYVTGEHTNSVRELALSNKHVSTLIGDFQGTIRAYQDEVSIVTLRNKTTDITTVPASGETRHIQFTAHDNRLSLVPSTHSLQQSILYTTSGGQATLIRANDTSQPYVARNDALEKKIPASGSYTLTRDLDDTSDTSYSLTMAQGYYVPIVQSFTEALEKQGVSPYEIKLTLSPGMRVTTTDQPVAPALNH